MKKLIALTAGLVAVVLGLLALGNALESHSCSETAEAMSVPASYSIWTGCVVEIDGRKMPLKNYRAVD